MVDNASELKPEWFAQASQVGVTAGASAPDVLVRSVIERIRELGADHVAELPGVEERVRFAAARAARAGRGVSFRLLACVDAPHTILAWGAPRCMVWENDNESGVQR